MITSIETAEISINDAVQNILVEAGVSFSVVLVGAIVRDKRECDQWRVTLSKGNNSETFDYFTGIGHRAKPTKQAIQTAQFDFHGLTQKDITGNSLYGRQYARHLETLRKPQTPEIAGILNSLVLDSSAGETTFHNWCMEYGYDNDSIKARKTYDQCQENSDKIQRIISRDAMDALRVALQDY